MISYRTIALFCIFLNISSIYGQEFSSGQEEADFRYLSVGLAPLSIYDISTPTLNVAVETNIFRTKTIELTYGIPVLAEAFDGAKRRISQHEYRLAIRQMPKISQLDKNAMVFVGLEYFGIYDNYTRRSGAIRIDNLDLCYRSADILRVVNGLRLEVGLKLFLKRFEVEFYTGGGLRRNTISHSHVEGLNQFNCIPEDGLFANLDFEPDDNRGGPFTTIDLNVGFKLSYAIRRFN